MERGAIYRLREGASYPGGFFNYGYKSGMYIGNSNLGWPQFLLANRVVIAVNCKNAEEILERIYE